jgi:glycosyltransferase involved in cell wall biosynthesis
VKKLSVVIPIYNVEPFLERCILSLSKQDLPHENYEIICINDGSPDHSRETVEILQKSISNIILIDQENQGVSRARNNGIKRAEGEYLLFVDPDDYVDPNSFNSILRAASSKEAEVVFLGYTVSDENGIVRRKVYNTDHVGNIYKGMTAYYLARGDGRTDPDRMWAILFKRSFLGKHNLNYLPDVPFLEDGELIARILCLAERCIFYGRSFYQRTTRIGSATNSGLFESEKASAGFLSAAKNLMRFKQEKTLIDAQKSFLNQPISKFVLLAFKSSLRNPSLKKYRFVRKNLILEGLKKLELDGVVRPYNFYACLYNYFTPIFLVNAFIGKLKQKLKRGITGGAR